MRNRLRVAIAEGNWSDPSIWNDNSVPEERDVVALNSRLVVMDQDVSIFNFTNRVTSAINSFPYLEYNNGPGGSAESSTVSSTAWRAFTTATGVAFNVPGGVSESNPFWLSYEYSDQEPIVLKKYQFNSYGSGHPYNPVSWLFQAWDGTNWITLDDRTNYGGNYTTYIGDLSSNSNAYYKYRFYVTQLQGGIDYSTLTIQLVRFWEDKAYSTDSAGGGTLTINNSKTLTVTDVVYSEFSDLIICNTTSSDTINLNLTAGPTWYGSNNQYATIIFNGEGTLNLNGGIKTALAYYQQRGTGMKVNGSNCTINVVGNVGGGGGNPSYGIITYGSNVNLNIIGDCEAGGGIGSMGVYFYNGGVLNITGNLYAWNTAYSGRGQHGVNVRHAASYVNIVGTINGSDNISASPYNQVNGLYIYEATEVAITGNVTGSRISSDNFNFYNSGIYAYISPYSFLSVIGSLTSGSGWPAIIQSTAAVNTFGLKVLSGPFVSNENGVLPFFLFNFKVQPSYSNYIRLYSNENPSEIYDLFSADTIVDSPIEEDVREGVTYANGSYTGTLVVPSPNQVSFGVPVDNTVGTAVLTGEDVWNIQTSAMNTDGSIGKRLKNASTVQSTGDQLSSAL